MAMTVFDLAGKLSLDSSEYDKGLADAEKKTSQFGSVLSGIGSGISTISKIGVAAIGTATAVTGALVNGAKEAASYGDSIDKMSQKLGMSAEAYQEWDAVMQHAGTSIESMQRGMTTLAKAAETDSDAFKQLGISEQEIASLSQEELFSRTIEGLQGMEAGTERTVLANKLLGGSAKELGALLNQSAEETQAMRDRVHELGGVMSDEAVKASAQFQDNLQDLQTAISGIKRGLTSDLLPSLNLIMEGFTALLAGEDGGPEKFAEGFSSMLEQVGDISGRVVDMLKTIVPSIVNVLTESLPEVVSFGTDLLTSIVGGIADNIDDALDVLLNLAGILFDGLASALPPLVDKIVAKVPDIVVSIADALTQALPVLLDAGGKLFDSLAEKLSNPSGIKKIVTSGVNLAVTIGNGIIKGMPKLVKMIPQVVKSLVSAITESAPVVMSGILELVNGIITELPNIILAIGEALPELIQIIADDISTNLPILINGLVSMIEMIAQNLPDIIDAIIIVLPQIIESIVNAMIQCTPVLIQGAVTLVTALAEHLPEICMALIAAIPQIIVAILGAFEPIVDGIGKVFSNAWESVKATFSKAPEWFKGIFDTAKNNIKEVFDNVKDNMSAVWQKIKDVFSKVGTWFKDRFTEAKKNIENAFSSIGQFFEEVWETIKNAFNISDALQWGKDLIFNFIAGIKDGISNLKDELIGIGKTIKGYIGFSEPKEGPLSNFHTFAPDMMQLFADGITDNAYRVEDALNDALDVKSAIPAIEFTGESTRNDSIYLQKMVELLQYIAEHGLDVALEGDAADIFKVVERENRISTNATGFNQLSMVEV